MKKANKTPEQTVADAMKDAIVVGETYHFWLDEEEDVYDRKYGNDEV